MNWEAIGAIGQIVGAIAVIATLVYLAIQIKQAHRQLELSEKRHPADAAREVLGIANQSEDLIRVFAQLGGFPTGDYGLDTEEDNVRFSTWCHSWMRTEEMNFLADSLEQKKTQEQLLKYWLSNVWGREFWTKNRAIYDVSFSNYMDKLLAEISRSDGSPEKLLSTREE